MLVSNCCLLFTLSSVCLPGFAHSSASLGLKTPQDPKQQRFRNLGKALWAVLYTPLKNAPSSGERLEHATILGSGTLADNLWASEILLAKNRDRLTVEDRWTALCNLRQICVSRSTHTHTRETPPYNYKSQLCWPQTTWTAQNLSDTGKTNLWQPHVLLFQSSLLLRFERLWISIISVLHTLRVAQDVLCLKTEAEQQQHWGVHLSMCPLLQSLSCCLASRDNNPHNPYPLWIMAVHIPLLD